MERCYRPQILGDVAELCDFSHLLGHNQALATFLYKCLLPSFDTRNVIGHQLVMTRVTDINNSVKVAALTLECCFPVVLILNYDTLGLKSVSSTHLFRDLGQKSI